MARRRVGVVLLIDPPVADEIDGLRRALGAADLARIPPHVTLVPPLNLRAADLPAALERLRSAASRLGGPLALTIGRAASFAPASPVLYLQVGGDLDGLTRLRDEVGGPPLDRRGPWPYVPHVTLVDGFPEDRTAGALELLGGYSALVEVERVVLMEERVVAASGPAAPRTGRRWAPLADAALGRRAVVGRGGLEIALTRGRVVGPDLVGLVASAGDGDPAGRGGPAPVDLDILAGGSGRAGTGRSFPAPVVLSAVRGSVTVGGAAAWWSQGRPEVGVLVDASVRNQGIGRHLLSRLEADLRGADWQAPGLVGAGPEGFYRACSRWVVGDGEQCG